MFGKMVSWGLQNLILVDSTEAGWPRSVNPDKSSLSWLTGNQIADSWILHLPSSETKEEREDRSLDYKEQLNLAADRLESTLWFGINEKMEDSVDLLRKTTKIPFRNLMT